MSLGCHTCYSLPKAIVHIKWKSNQKQGYDYQVPMGYILVLKIDKLIL